MYVVEWASRVSWLIVLCALVLMGWGYGCIVRGDELVGDGTLAARQAIWIAVSVPVMWGATLIPYHIFRRFSYLFYAVCLVLLSIACLMPPVNGSRAWIPLGFMNLQPSEMAKIAFIMTLAHYLMYRQNYRRWSGLIVPFLLTIVPVLLILKEPDLGSALLFFPVLFAMLFAAGARPRHLVLISLMGLTSLPVIWWQMNAEQRSRIIAVFLQEDGGEVPKGSLYHLHQSKQVLALGGTWGSRWGGMPSDDPLAYHLPASRTDFVFCLLGERFGFWGCGAVMAFYLILFAKGLRIAAQTREPFGRLLAVGIVSLLAAQTIVNLGMTVGLMPITGITLPLMSYGGSSLLATCFALGLLINVHMRPGYDVCPEPFRFGSKMASA